MSDKSIESKDANAYRLECSCDDWTPNIDKINGPIVLQSIRSGGAYQYAGKKMVFCPWCGNKLTSIPT